MFAVFLILFLAFTPLAGIYFANKSSGSTGVTQNTTSKKPSTTKEEPKKQEVAPKTVEKRIETPAPVKAPEPVVAPTRIPEEDAPKPIVPKDEKPSTVSSSKSGTPTDSTSEEFDLPSKLHKHVIGTGGKIIKEIQTNHNVKIDLIGDENKMKIVSKDDNSANVANAFSAVRKALEEVGWFFENNEWVEKLAYDAIYKEWNIKIENEAKLMTKCFEDAKTNFEQGNKEEAKNLSTQGKVHQENMHKYKQECAQAVFDFLNAKHDDNTMDLHGQLVAEAMQFVEKRIEKLKGTGATLDIITGAGNHSDEKGAKIKPAVVKYLGEQALKYEEINNGTLRVTF